MFVSSDILEEYADVLSRPELRIPRDEQRALMNLITARARLVVPKRRLTVADPDDNVFLECAETARADYLITGNAKHLPRFWRNTKIINARELLQIIAPHLP